MGRIPMCVSRTAALFACFVFAFFAPMSNFDEHATAQAPAEVDLAILDFSVSNACPNESEVITISVVVQDLLANGSGTLRIFAYISNGTSNDLECISSIGLSGLGLAHLEAVDWTVARNATKLAAFIDNVSARDASLGNNYEEVTIDVNNRPVASLLASTNETMSLVYVEFSGIGSYDEDGIFAYRFDFGDGTGTSWQSNPLAVHAYARASSKAYTARLVVRDTKGLESMPDSTSVFVNNRPPMLSARINDREAAPDSIYNVTSIETVEFSSYGSVDLDGDIVNFTWDFGDGAVSYEANATHRYAFSESVYVVQLYATDNLGATNGTSFKIAVQNIAPIANFTFVPEGGNSTTTFYFDAHLSSDADDEISTYIWSFGDGAGAYGSIVQHRYYAFGTFNVSLVVIDGRGVQSISCVKQIVVNNTPARPRISILHSQGLDVFTGDVVGFDASLSEDIDGNISSMTFLWWFGDDDAGTGIRCEHIYSKPGIYHIELLVVDSAGEPSSAHSTIVISNRPPTILSAEYEPSEPLVGNGVHFTVRAEDHDGSVSRFDWDFNGDGKVELTTDAGCATYAFERTGSFAASVTVFDEIGGLNVTTMNLNVTGDNSGLAGVFMIAYASCGYTAVMLVVVMLCVVTWYAFMKVRFDVHRSANGKAGEGSKQEKGGYEAPKGPSSKMYVRAATGQTNVDAQKVHDVHKSNQRISRVRVKETKRDKDNVELKPDNEKVITFEVEKIADESEEENEEVSENDSEETLVEASVKESDVNIEGSTLTQDGIKVEFMEIKDAPGRSSDVELKNIDGCELLAVTKAENPAKDVTINVDQQKMAERALAEKEEGKKTAKRFAFANEKLEWCEARLEELSKAGALTDVEKEDIAGPIRLGRTYLRSKNASKAEKFALRAEEETKSYLAREKKRSGMMQ